jgi:hypothetical protein
VLARLGAREAAAVKCKRQLTRCRRRSECCGGTNGLAACRELSGCAPRSCLATAAAAWRAPSAPTTATPPLKPAPAVAPCGAPTSTGPSAARRPPVGESAGCKPTRRWSIPPRRPRPGIRPPAAEDAALPMVGAPPRARYAASACRNSACPAIAWRATSRRR